MSRNLTFWFASVLACTLCFAAATAPLGAVTYHIGTTGTNTSTDEYYANLQALRTARGTLSNDTLIFYQDRDDSWTSRTAFAVTGTLDIRSSVEGDQRIISGQNLGGRIFDYNGTNVTISKDFTIQDINSSASGTMALYGNSTVLTVDGVTFRENYSSSFGGAIDTYGGTNQWINARGAQFLDNEGSRGGGVELFLMKGGDFTNANFLRNEAFSERGGAIIVLLSASVPCEVILGATDGETSTFEGNKFTGFGEDLANSLYVTNSGTLDVRIQTEGTGILDLRDPIVLTEGNNYTANFIKTGAGTWKVDGYTDINTGTGKSTISIEEGTFYMYEGAQIDMKGANDAFIVGRGETSSSDPTVILSGDNIIKATTATFAAGSRIELYNQNRIDGTTVTFEAGSNLAFDMSFYFEGGHSRDTAMLELGGTTLNVQGTIINVDNLPGTESAKGAYTLIQGDNDLSAGRFMLLVNNALVEQTSSNRFGYGLNNDADPTQLVLYIRDTENSVLTWNNAAGTGKWNYADQNWNDPYVTRGTDAFIPNDSVVFVNTGVVGGTNTIAIEGNIVVSKDANRPSGDRGTGERGMRVSGTENWVFNGGSISDNYVTTPGLVNGPDFLAALIFDGSGTLTLNNDEANTYHDGTYISGGGTIIARRVDSLGSSEYAGFTTTGRRVQEEGYGILFSNRGGTIRLQSGTTSDSQTGLPISGVFDQRISVAANSNGTLELAGSVQRLVVTADSAYRSYASDKRGGAVNIGQGGSFTATGNIVFLQNETNSDGGAVFGAERSEITTDNVQFVLNTAGRDGGAIYGGQQSVITLNGSRFNDNTAGNDGGAVYAGAQSEVAVTSSQFDTNTATQGGAVYLGSRAEVTVDASGFTNNTATRGGAIYAEDQVVLTADASTFTDNQANRGGAIYAASRAQLTAGASIFTGNEADDLGGAIYAADRAGVTVDASRFLDNTADRGGAIYHAGNSGSLSAQNAVFGAASDSANTADEGGAIYLANGQAMKLDATGAQFASNAATTGSGGALYVGGTGLLSGNYVTLDGTTFDANSANVSGGAVYLIDFVLNGDKENRTHGLSAAGATFTNNTAATGDGGAIRAGMNAFLDLSGTESSQTAFTGNRANLSGGAVAVGANGEIIADNANFTDNEAGQRGGAIYLGSRSELRAHGSAFITNLVSGNGSLGGAIYSDGAGTYSLQSSLFRENSAKVSGGAIYIGSNSGVDGYDLDLTDTIFETNKAETGDGGAIYAAQHVGVSSITATGSTFQNNSAGISGGAIYAEDDVTLTAENAAFQKNTATQHGGAIRVGDGATIEISFAVFTENTFGNARSEGGAIYAGDDVSITGTDAAFLNNGSSIYGLYGGAVRVGDNAVLNFIGAEFSANTVNAANSRGGAVYAGDGMELTVASAEFKSNTAKGSGGAVDAADNATIISSSTRFVGNSAGTTGGVISVNDGAYFELVSGTFTSNTGGTDGGAIYAVDGTRIFGSDNQFGANTAEKAGGAIFVNDHAIIGLISGKFNDNKAGTDGGAIAAGTDAMMRIAGTNASDRIEFSKNIAGGSGGAIRVVEGTMFDVENANFNLNQAGGSGGAVSLGKANAGLLGVTMTRNTAGVSGGAVHMDSGVITIDGSNLSVNIAETVGGAVRIGAGTTMSVTDSEFGSNKAGQSGGAVHSAGTAAVQNVLTISGTSFQGNVSTAGDGGAVYATYTTLSGSPLSTFSNNSAAGSGGAIYAGTGTETSSFDVTASVFNTNSARTDGGALYFAESVNLFVKNGAATFSVNSARSGGAIYAKAGGTLTLGSSNFSSNRAGDGSGGAILLGASETGSSISGSGVSFIDNRAQAGSGGAIYAVNTDLDFTDATFFDNTASQKGGAILYETTGGNRTIDFNVGTGETSTFSGNRAGNLGSSIHFVGKDSMTTIDMTIDTAEGGVFELYDAMIVDAADHAVKLDITKTGPGTWKLGDVHDLRGTDAGSTVEIAGVLDLQRGAGVLLANTDELDSFVMKSGTGLIVRAGNEISATEIIIADDMNFDLDGIAADSAMVALTLTGSVETVSGNAIGAGTINIVDFIEQSGSYNLVRAENGRLADTGTLQYKGLNIENNDRLKDYWSLAVDDEKSMLKLELRPWEHTEMIWTPDPETGNNLWNMEERNWYGWSKDIEVDQFVDGDSVRFDGNGPGLVLVSPNDVRVDSMVVDADESYEFQGGTITGNTFEKLRSGSMTMSTRFEFDTFDVYHGTLLGGLGSDWVLVGRTGPAHLHLHDGSMFRPTDKFRVDGNITMHGGSSAQWELGATQSLSSAVSATGTVDFDLNDGNVMIFIDNNGLSSGQYGTDAPILLADAGLTIDGQAIEEGVYGVNRRVVLVAGENGMLALQSDRSMALQAAVIGGNSTELSLIAFGTGFGAEGPTSDDFNVNQLAIYAALENAPYQSLANEFFGELAKLGTVEEKAEALDGIVTTIGNAAMLVAERSIVRVSSTIFERVHLLNEIRSREQGHAGQTALGQSPYDRGSNFSPWFTNLGDFQDQNDSRRARGFHSKMYGFMVGVDRSYSRETVVGLGLSGTFASVDAGSYQSARADTYMASIYGAYTFDDWTLTGNAGYASSEYSFKRRIFTVDSEIKQRGDSFVWGVELSKKLRNGDTDIRPYGSLQFVSIDVGSHVDRSLGVLGNVKTDSGRSHSALQNLGVKFGREFTGPLGAVWMPSFNAAWLHDYGKGNLRSKTAFGDGPAFTIIGAERARDRILLGLGSHVAYQYLTFFGSFDSEFSGRMSSQTLQLGFNFVF